jgi:hypothetical protein
MAAIPSAVGVTDRRVVVVDGSNLATEGRTTPSLQQLDDGVQGQVAVVVQFADGDFQPVRGAGADHGVGLQGAQLADSGPPCG